MLIGMALALPFLPSGWWPALLGPVVGAATVVIVTLVFAFWQSRRHIPPWLCPNCRYDRRGLERKASCPECGQSPKA